MPCFGKRITLHKINDTTSDLFKLRQLSRCFRMTSYHLRNPNMRYRLISAQTKLRQINFKSRNTNIFEFINFTISDTIQILVQSVIMQKIQWRLHEYFFMSRVQPFPFYILLNENFCRATPPMNVEA